jgi:methionyl-tRNA synthetase
MFEKYSDGMVPAVSGAGELFPVDLFWNQYEEAFDAYKFDNVVSYIMQVVAKCDQKISEDKPWELFKQGQDISGLLYQLGETSRHIAVALLPIIPDTSAKILSAFGIDAASITDLSAETSWGKLPGGTKVTKGDILFPRLVK